MGSRLIALVAVGALIVAGAVAAVVAADEGPHSGGDWPRFGKTTDNTRFSPADRIDASTVGDLELAWELGQEHAAPSRESNPVVVDRRMYLTTASGEVLALDAVTGKPIWKHDPARRGGTAWSSPAGRGVAVADGKVYALTFDCHLFALDERTGRRVWHTQLADRRSCTAAPTAWDGMVFAGAAGARGFVAELDGETGEEEWRRYGSAVSMPPTIDTTTGVLYTVVGGPAPDLAGSPRPGPGRDASGLLALRARTGELEWSHRVAPRDAWERNAGSPVVLFDTTVNGRGVRAVGRAGRGGRFFALSARAGRPLYPAVPFVTRSGAAPRRAGGLGSAADSPLAFSPKTGAAYVPGPGTFTAIDVERGRVRWQRRLDAPMLGGATATAGGLVFAGDASGTLYAFDADDGDIAWRRPFASGFGSAPVVYTIDGVEYLAVVSGGGAEAAVGGARPAGAGLLVFSLG
jgi:glucose dehydrogenase